MKPQICRYDDGADIFAEASIQALMVTYTPDEIEGWFNGASRAVKTVDRYVSIVGNDTNGKVIDCRPLIGWFDIYANYIYIENIDAIQFYNGYIFDRGVKIHSHESGYTEVEYLGLFTEYTAESYSGTLLYFATPTKIQYLGALTGNIYEEELIAPGFYYILASDDGTSLSKLAENPDDYKVKPEDLKNYSVYINADGSLSNAYVDTGLFDNNSVGLGGFSGGSVK
ncbi:MAG: hypothetical protein MR487_02555 [Lachnospiraceae bacterium]|nr:hypothetical protein [Lachnospiraceae bacterium]